MYTHHIPSQTDTLCCEPGGTHEICANKNVFTCMYMCIYMHIHICIYDFHTTVLIYIQMDILPQVDTYVFICIYCISCMPIFVGLRYIYTHHIRVCIHIYTILQYLWVCVCVYVHTFMSIHIIYTNYVCVCACTYIYTYICILMYVCIYIYKYINSYMHTYPFKFKIYIYTYMYSQPYGHIMHACINIHINVYIHT